MNRIESSRVHDLERRATKVDALWNDEQRYASVIARGGFMKLCDATRLIAEQFESLARGKTRR